MRLICPRCGAQYEIDAAAIPAAGRDVECSACDHVWRAWPMPGQAEPFDPTARPRLSRPLSESVIEILRQEAARELEVRAAERRAQRLAEAGVVGTGVAEAGEVETPFSDAAAAGAVAPSPDDTLLPGDAPEVQSGGADDALAATPPAKPPAALAAATPAVQPPAAPAVAIPAASPPTAPAVTAKQSAALPAATPAAQPPTIPVPAPRPQPASAWAAAPPAPAQAVSRRRYDAGFHLAVMLALMALALYALAPRLGDQQPLGPVLLEWRGKVDQGRDWLSAKGDAAIAGLRAVINGQDAAGD
ncbi:MAG TPA: zinc-ribbon domain-containing protein [Paracoccus solventivorans]|uniref:zinc-ribbon domain-containing protein n=1 Tax=Paracoccus solventivorans TaxID=53463 RepID=UPI002C439D45|nr:zinc-ribbon domain-containing protein [Paracoccus solventivorans]HMM09647.1 zinc-ribbon domain-containing protein [Paracoccus solventivorans]